MQIGFILGKSTKSQTITTVDPMKRKIAKLIVGKRPSLNKTYLTNNGIITTDTENYRHIIAYDLIQRALAKAVRNLTCEEVIEWLETPEAWVDQNTRKYYLTPVLISGKIPPTILSVQAALGAWLENATTYIQNLYAGDAKINKSKGARINSSFDALKGVYQQELCKRQDIVAIRCFDPINGKDQRIRFNGTILPNLKHGTITKYLKSLWGKTAEGQLLANPGTRFELVYDNSGSQVSVIVNSLLISGSMVYAVSKSYRAGASINQQPVFSDNLLKATIDPLSLATLEFEKIQKTHLAEIYADVVSEQFTVMAPFRKGNGGLEFKKVSLVALALGWKEGKYFPRGKDLDKFMAQQLTEGNSYPQNLTDTNFKAQTQIDRRPGSTHNAIQAPTNTKRTANSSAIALNFFDDNGLDSLDKFIVKAIIPDRPPNKSILQKAFGRNDAQKPIEVQVYWEQQYSGLPQNQAKEKVEQKVEEFKQLNPKQKRTAYRHKLGYNLIASALKKILKDKTPNEIADWLDRDDAWFNKDIAEKYKQPLFDTDYLRSDKILRTLPVIQKAAWAWLEHAANHVANFYRGNKYYNGHRGGKLNGALTNLKKQVRHYIAEIKHIKSISGFDKVADTADASYQVFIPGGTSQAISGNFIDIINSHGLRGGYKLVAPSGGSMHIVYNNDTSVRFGAVLIDKNGLVFAASRDYEITGNALNLTAIPASTEIANFKASLEEYLKASVDDKSLEFKLVNEIKDQDIAILYTNLQSLTVMVPEVQYAFDGERHIVYRQRSLGAIALSSYKYRVSSNDLDTIVRKESSNPIRYQSENAYWKLTLTQAQRHFKWAENGNSNALMSLKQLIIPLIKQRLKQPSNERYIQFFKFNNLKEFEAKIDEAENKSNTESLLRLASIQMEYIKVKYINGNSSLPQASLPVANTKLPNNAKPTAVTAPQIISTSNTKQISQYFSERKRRKGLNTLEAQVQLSPNFEFGTAVDNGDCFFDSIAQALNKARNTNEFTDKSMRKKCHEYYLENKEWVDKQNKKDYGGLDTGANDYFFVQYTQPELEQNFYGRSPIWGRSQVEGVMLCNALNLSGILVLEIMIVENKPAIGYYLANKTDYRQIDNEQLIQKLFANKNILKLAVGQKSLHFVPIMPKAILVPTLTSSHQSSLGSTTTTPSHVHQQVASNQTRQSPTRQPGNSGPLKRKQEVTDLAEESKQPNKSTRHQPAEHIIRDTYKNLSKALDDLHVAQLHSNWAFVKKIHEYLYQQVTTLINARVNEGRNAEAYLSYYFGYKNKDELNNAFEEAKTSLSVLKKLVLGYLKYLKEKYGFND